MQSDGVNGDSRDHLQQSTAQEVASKAAAYLRWADRVVPGFVTGFYVVGSAALGEYVPGRSDLDFVAVMGDEVGRSEIRRLRLLHVLAGADSLAKATARGRRPISGTANGVFVRQGEIALPVTRIRPIASHTGHQFVEGRAFDVNPVVWKTLVERGLTFRGPEPAQLGLDSEPQTLSQWNLANLESYWRAWGSKVSAGGHGFFSPVRVKYGGRWIVAWGVLGAPRLHCTITTGEVVGKRSAGEYALDVFEAQWHPIVEKGLSYWQGGEVNVSPRDVCRAGEFVLAVVESARSYKPPDPSERLAETGPR
jgi:hypothetical protein